MRLSDLTRRVSGGGADAWDLHYAAKAARERGEDVIVLSVGDPDFATPAPVVERACRALREGDTHYTSIAGDEKLRALIAARHSERSGAETGVDHVILTSGAQNALFSSALCLLDPGDEAIVLQPMYVTYEATVRASGATLKPVVLDPADGFRLDPARLEAAIGERSRAIFFASPCNPTGIVLGADEIGAIAALAERHDLWVVADEVYADFVFNGEFTPAASDARLRDRLVSVGSMSKAYAMTGWRLGWAIAPPPLIAAMDKLALCMLYGLPGFVQQAALAAFEQCQAEQGMMRDRYRQRLEFLYREFDAMPGLRPLMPDAGMFMLVDVRGSGREVGEFTAALYRDTGVSLLDASAFGASAEGHVRVSCTVPDDELREACRRMRAWLE